MKIYKDLETLQIIDLSYHLKLFYIEYEYTDAQGIHRTEGMTLTHKEFFDKWTPMWGNTPAYDIVEHLERNSVRLEIILKKYFLVGNIFDAIPSQN